MTELVFTGLIVKQSRGYTALCPELDVATEGATPKAARRMLQEAVTLYLETALENNLPYLRPIQGEDNPLRTTPEQVVDNFPLRVSAKVLTRA